MKYPTKLVERSVHGKTSSYLVKVTGKETPSLPKCIPVGISTIGSYGILIPENVVHRFRINDGPIEVIEVSMGSSEGNPIVPEKVKNLINGVSMGLGVYPNITGLQKFYPPDAGWFPGIPDYVGGLSENGVVNLFGHDINVEDTVYVEYGFGPDDVTYFKVNKAIRNEHKVELFPSDEPEEGRHSYYSNLMDNEFYRHQKSKESEWLPGEPIVTLSCGAVPFTPFIPSKPSDIECGYVEVKMRFRDGGDFGELSGPIMFKVDGVSYPFKATVDSDSGIPVNDGMLTITNIDGAYVVSVCCTDSRTPVTVAFDDPRVIFDIYNRYGPQQSYSNSIKSPDGSLKAILTPPAIAPFGASNQIGLHVPNRGVGELWGVVSINGVSYGRKKLGGGSSKSSFIVNGHTFNSRYDEDYNVIITLGDDGQGGGGIILGGKGVVVGGGQPRPVTDSGGNWNPYTYYKIEIEFDTTSTYLKPTGVWYQTQGWDNPLLNKNFTTSLNTRTNKLTAFMRYMVDMDEGPG